MTHRQMALELECGGKARGVGELLRADLATALRRAYRRSMCLWRSLFWGIEVERLHAFFGGFSGLGGRTWIRHMTHTQSCLLPTGTLDFSFLIRYIGHLTLTDVLVLDGGKSPAWMRNGILTARVKNLMGSPG